MGNTVKIFEKSFTFSLGESLPDFLEDELMSICDDSADEGYVEKGYIVFWVKDGIL